MKKLLVLLTLVIISSQTLFAGFPIGQGRWLLVPTYTKYKAHGYWDDLRSFNEYSNNGVVESNYFGLYGGYGIGRDLDFKFNIPYLYQQRAENNILIDQPLSTFGDAKFGFTYFLNHFDFFKHLSITPSIILPLYNSIESDLMPGFASPGGELKLGLAGTNTTTLKDTYYDMEVGVRKYFNAGEPTQGFAKATLGSPIGDNWKVSGTLDGVVSSGEGTNRISAFQVNRTFDYVRGTLGVGRRLNRNMYLWGSIFSDFIGRNIGQGRGFSIYTVIKF